MPLFVKSLINGKFMRVLLKILASSSRRPENVIEEEVLAKFTFYNLIGKIIFYLTLSENLSAAYRSLI